MNSNLKKLEIKVKLKMEANSTTLPVTDEIIKGLEEKVKLYHGYGEMLHLAPPTAQSCYPKHVSKESVVDMRGILSTLFTRIKQDHHKISKLQRDFHTDKEDKESAENKLLHVKSKSKSTGSSALITNLKAKLSRSREKRRRLEMVVHHLKREEKQFGDRCIELSIEVFNLKEVVKAKEEELMTITNDKNKSNLEVIELKKLIHSIDKASAEKDSHLKRVIDNHSEFSKSLSKANLEIKDDKHRLEALVAEYNEHVKTLTAENVKLSEDLKKLEKEIPFEVKHYKGHELKLIDSIQDLTSKVEGKDREIKEKNMELKYKDDQLEVLRNEMIKLKDGHQEHNNIMIADIHRVCDDRDKARFDLNKIDTHLKDLKTQIIKIELENVKLTKVNEDLITLNSKLSLFIKLIGSVYSEEIDPEYLKSIFSMYNQS